MLINMTEHSNTNCKLVESLRIDPAVAKQLGSAHLPRESCDLGDEYYDRRSVNSSIQALVNLFLDHHAKADSANIEVT